MNGCIFAKIAGSDTYYYIRDALGSTRQVWKSGDTSPTFSVATHKSHGTPVTPISNEKFEYAANAHASRKIYQPPIDAKGVIRWRRGAD